MNMSYVKSPALLDARAGEESKKALQIRIMIRTPFRISSLIAHPQRDLKHRCRKTGIQDRIIAFPIDPLGKEDLEISLKIYSYAD